MKEIQYILGQVSKGGGLPVNVRIGIDKDLKKTLLTGIGILSVGIVIGAALNRKKTRL